MRGSTKQIKVQKEGEKERKPTKEKRKQTDQQAQKKTTKERRQPNNKENNQSQTTQKHTTDRHQRKHHQKTEGNGHAKLNVLTLFKTEFASELKANSEKREQFLVLPPRV